MWEETVTLLSRCADVTDGIGASMRGDKNLDYVGEILRVYTEAHRERKWV